MIMCLDESNDDSNEEDSDEIEKPKESDPPRNAIQIVEKYNFKRSNLSEEGNIEKWDARIILFVSLFSVYLILIPCQKINQNQE